MPGQHSKPIAPLYPDSNADQGDDTSYFPSTRASSQQIGEDEDNDLVATTKHAAVLGWAHNTDL